MEDTSRSDIRRLLKTFGIQADEAMITHLAQNPALSSLHVRLVLEDLTEYGDSPSPNPLQLEIEGEIRNS